MSFILFFSLKRDFQIIREIKGFSNKLKKQMINFDDYRKIEIINKGVLKNTYCEV